MATAAATQDDLDELPFVIDKTGKVTMSATEPIVDRRKSTVFVRNLPFDFTDDQLQRKFEEIAPVKRAFIVTGKKANQGSRGFGFVIYADESDAADAVQQLHNTELSGRKIKVELARAPAAAATAQEALPVPSRPKRVRRRQFSKKKPDAGAETAVILEGIDTLVAPKQLAKKVRKYGPAPIIDYPAAESTSTNRVARVTFASAAAARDAVRHLDRKALVVTDSEPIRAGWAALKCARVILRNIPFNCKEPRLKLLMKPFGKINDVHLPKDPDNANNKGFCFVQFDDLTAASKAVAQGSVQLGGRAVAIDWALSKTHYLSHQGDDDDAMDTASEASSDAEMDEGHESDIGETPAEASDDEQLDLEASADDQEMEEVEDDGRATAGRDPSRASRDVQEQRTVFVRNLPFESREPHVKELFARFGKVKSVMIVMDRDIGKPKGCAFVQFADSSAAAAAVQYAAAGWSNIANRTDKTRRLKTASDQGLLLGGRTLDVTLAVDRSQASHLQNEAGKLKKDDKKQAHLAREGYIKPESDAAKGLTKIDLALRSKLYKETVKKLDNPNYVMSRCRLSIHNLPDGIDEKTLKSRFVQAVKESSPSCRPIVKQCIIVRDKTALDKEGKPRSLHYGFIEFLEHEHALLALRALNNKPNGLGPNTHRLIIMFAVDDMRKLAMRKSRLVKSQQKLQVARLQKELLPSSAHGSVATVRKRRRGSDPQLNAVTPRKKRSKK